MKTNTKEENTVKGIKGDIRTEKITDGRRKPIDPISCSAEETDKHGSQKIGQGENLCIK